MKGCIKHIILILVGCMLVGCGKSASIDGLMLDGKKLTLEENSYISQSALNDNISMSGNVSFEKGNLLFDDGIESNHVLKVKGMGLGSTIDEVLETLNIESGQAYYNYEYYSEDEDTTDVEEGIYMGEIEDFKEKNILDYYVTFKYIYDNGKWQLFDYRNKDKTKEYILLSFDFSGNEEVYGIKERTCMFVQAMYVKR